MRRLKLLIVLITGIPLLNYSQGIELVPSAGYMFGGSIKYYEGKLKIQNNANYGVSVLVPVQPLIDVELNYTRMDSKASFTPNPGYPLLTYEETTLGTNYFQVGALSKFYRKNTKAIPFGSLSIGATWFSSPDIEDVWRFSATAGLGVKVMLSEKVGIMLRGRLMMPMNFGGTSFYFGTGGSGFSLNSNIAPFQGDFNGGLIIKLG